MKMVFEFWTTLDSASAVVIVDELDAHLHPRWKMRIVTALRTAFPNIQFIASTHDPLLLRGLRNHEIALITRVDGVGTVVNTQLPPIEGMQVDEILTSSVFGLDSTMDPETEALFDEYYYLISHSQTDTDRARVAELRQRLADRESLGRNARENLMLEAAQKFLKETEDRPPLDMNRLRAETVQTLREMFADVSLPPRRS
ncbi:AAA family ATPase [Sphingomonas sp. I4]